MCQSLKSHEMHLGHNAADDTAADDETAEKFLIVVFYPLSARGSGKVWKGEWCGVE